MQGATNPPAGLANVHIHDFPRPLVPFLAPATMLIMLSDDNGFTFHPIALDVPLAVPLALHALARVYWMRKPAGCWDPPHWRVASLLERQLLLQSLSVIYSRV